MASLFEDQKKLLLQPAEGVDQGTYAAESDLESAHRCPEGSSRSPRTIATVSRRLGTTLLVILAVYGLLSMSIQVYNRLHSVRPKQCYCGNSVEEAISLGCRYDSLAAAWLPDYCRDDELSTEFETEGPGPNGTWIYWRDSKHSIEISTDEIAAGGGDPDALFRMSWDWHKGETAHKLWRC